MNSRLPRLDVVDALRGFAIVSIMLLHNLEHFDFYYLPTNLPSWLINVDKIVWDSMFFLFSGKSYAIFALLFGLTFFIQSKNQERIGNDFRGRFAWRLCLLLCFGIVNSAFYQGDILSIYAVLGFFLIPVSRLNDRTIFIIALVLMLQPFEWIKYYMYLTSPKTSIPDPLSWQYFAKTGEYLSSNSLLKTIVGNLTNGKIAVLNWTWENGRVFQTISLFMFGMLAGRRFLFFQSAESKKFWIKALAFSLIAFPVLYYVKGISGLQPNLNTIITSINNMAFTLLLVSIFTLLYTRAVFSRLLEKFSSLGRMSLTNYVMQSIIGSFIYYGFGLGLYQHTGATISLFIGLFLAVLQSYFSHAWMKKHKHGPLESLWHKATWAYSNTKKTSLEIANYM